MVSICFKTGFLSFMAMSASAVMLMACATAPRDVPPAFSGGAAADQPALSQRPSFSPWLSLTGARQVAASDRTGTPAAAAATLGYTRFIRPVALAARGGEVVILDAGAGTAYRYDAALDLMTALGGVAVHPGTQLALGADYSLYVIDPPRRRVVRVARSGQQLTHYASADLQRPVDVAVDDARGLVYVADGGYNQLLAFQMLGGAATVIHVRGGEGARLQAVGNIALGPDAIYVADPLCRCLGRVAYLGGVLSTFGHDTVGAPGPLAVDRNRRVFVIDQFARVLKVFHQGRLIDTLPPRRFGLQQIDDLWIDDNVLYLADGLSGRVAAQRIAVAGGP